MPHDSAREFQRLVALIFFGERERPIKIFPGEVGGSGILEFSDALLRFFQASLSFFMIADIGGLQGKIDAPRRGIGHVGRH